MTVPMEHVGKHLDHVEYKLLKSSDLTNHYFLVIPKIFFRLKRQYFYRNWYLARCQQKGKTEHLLYTCDIPRCRLGVIRPPFLTWQRPWVTLKGVGHSSIGSSNRMEEYLRNAIDWQSCQSVTTHSIQLLLKVVTYMQICTHILTYTYIQMHINIHTYKYVHTCIYNYIHINTYMDTNAHICTIHPNIYTNTHIIKFIQICMYRHIQICTYTYIHNTIMYIGDYAIILLFFVCDSIINNQTPALTTTTIEKSQTLLSVPWCRVTLSVLPSPDNAWISVIRMESEGAKRYCTEEKEPGILCSLVLEVV